MLPREQDVLRSEKGGATRRLTVVMCSGNQSASFIRKGLVDSAKSIRVVRPNWLEKHPTLEFDYLRAYSAMSEWVNSRLLISQTLEIKQAPYNRRDRKNGKVSTLLSDAINGIDEWKVLPTHLSPGPHQRFLNRNIAAASTALHEGMLCK